MEAEPLSSLRTVLAPFDRVGAGALVGEVGAPPQTGDEDAIVVAVAETILYTRSRVGRRLDANVDLSSVGKASKLKDAYSVAILGSGLTEVAGLGAEAVWPMVRPRPT